MALGWLTVLKTVPWTQVLSNAPVVAEGARKLWNAVGSRPVAPEATAAAAPSASGGNPAADAVPALQRRLDAAEAACQELQAQMRASSELIKALAEQNTELVKGIEAQRARALWLTLGCAAAGLMALASLLVAWSARVA